MKLLLALILATLLSACGGGDEPQTCTSDANGAQTPTCGAHAVTHRCVIDGVAGECS